MNNNEACKQKRFAIVQTLLPDQPYQAKPRGHAFAPVNFALIKYWGKRDACLHLPVTDSLSLTIDHLGTHTTIQEVDAAEDVYHLNHQPQPLSNSFSVRLSAYLDLFRPKGVCYDVNTQSDIAVASGLASSASGFAALIKALDDLYDWRLSLKDLSILARLGSGSACRSLYSGFVHWHKGAQANGMDSFAEPVEHRWPAICVGILHVSDKVKSVSSTEAMAHTVNTSPLYQTWPNKVSADLDQLYDAIKTNDFPRFGKIVEENALAMHATAHQAKPPINYDHAKTRHYQQAIQTFRSTQNIPLYFTQDAGPNLKLLYLKCDEAEVLASFPDLAKC